MRPWLSVEEICELCYPLTQPAAQARFIERELRVPVKRKPGGGLVVLRSSIEQLHAPLPAAAAARQAKQKPQPDVDGLQLFLAERKAA